MKNDTFKVRFQMSDGGRRAAGYSHTTSDCAVRTMAVLWEHYNQCTPAEAYHRCYTITQLADMRQRPKWSDGDSEFIRMAGYMVDGSLGFMHALEFMDFDEMHRFKKNEIDYTGVASALRNKTAAILTRDPDHLYAMINGTIFDMQDMPERMKVEDKPFWPERIYMRRGHWTTDDRMALRQAAARWSRKSPRTAAAK